MTDLTLNPIFADMPTSKLITRLETGFAFKSPALEQELTARLQLIGRHWHFSRGGKIEILPLHD